MTIQELIKSADVKAEAFNIEAIENGFIVKFSYRTKPDKKEDLSSYWDYKSKQYVFGTWEEAVKFLSENALPQPPK